MTIKISPFFGYEVHLGGYGWKQGVVYDGMATGTVGKSLRIEAVRFTNLPPNVQVRGHVTVKGWLDWVEGNSIVGTTNQSRQLEALEFRVTDNAAPLIYGRAHVAGTGWQPVSIPFAGSILGTTHQGREIEALQFWLVVPGSLLTGRDPQHYFPIQFKTGFNELAARDAHPKPPRLPDARDVLERSAGTAACALGLGVAGAACIGSGLTLCLGGAAVAVAVCAVEVAQGQKFIQDASPPADPGGHDGTADHGDDKDDDKDDDDGGGGEGT